MQLLSPAMPFFGDIVLLPSQILLQYSCAPPLQTAMTNVVTPGLAVMYIQSTGEHARATIIGRSTHEEDSTTEELQLGSAQSCPHTPQPRQNRLVATIVLRVRYGHVFGTCFLLVPRTARLHRLVLAPGPGLTLTFLTWLVLAQEGAGVGMGICGHVERGNPRQGARGEH